MNHPSGFRLVAGRVVDVNPWKALFGNDFLWHELIHMYIAAYLVTGFVMAGVYAAARLRGRWTRYERAAIALPLMIASLAAPIQILIGDWAARTISRDEPTKLAAIEGLAETTEGAPLHVFGLYEHGQVRYGVRIPKALSVLAVHAPGARVQGLDAGRPWNRPPVNVVRVSFQTMVGIGTLLAILGILTWSCACADGGCPLSGRTTRPSWPQARCPWSRSWPAGSRPRSAASPGSSTE